jgi:hypothetical protein
MNNSPDLMDISDVSKLLVASTSSANELGIWSFRDIQAK